MIGPPLEEGPLPALFYFSLSDEESLHLAPFNTPVTLLGGKPLRIFSITLPAHGPGFDKHKAIAQWAEWIGEGKKPLVDCIESICKTIDSLYEKNLITTLATAGLSRGAFFATHIAACEPRVRAVLGFAPLTDLSYAKDFAAIKEDPHVKTMALHHLVPSLINTPIRFYIGNRDTAVSTSHCFQFIDHLANTAFDNGIRSPRAELVISPSIGHRGHGTPAHIFEAGANWIWDQLS